MPSDKAMTNAPERIWRLDCQGEILYLETPPYDERTADSVEYIRADKVKEMLDQHAAEAVIKYQNFLKEYPDDPH